MVVCAGIGDGVANTDTVTFQQQPIIDHSLNVSIKSSVFLKRKILSTLL